MLPLVPAVEVPDVVEPVPVLPVEVLPPDVVLPAVPLVVPVEGDVPGAVVVPEELPVVEG